MFPKIPGGLGSCHTPVEPWGLSHHNKVGTMLLSPFPDVPVGSDFLSRPSLPGETSRVTACQVMGQGTWWRTRPKWSPFSRHSPATCVTLASSCVWTMVVRLSAKSSNFPKVAHAWMKKWDLNLVCVHSKSRLTCSIWEQGWVRKQPDHTQSLQWYWRAKVLFGETIPKGQN